MTQPPSQPESPYELFRSTADLTVWTNCAQLICDDIEQVRTDEHGWALSSGLCVTAYLAWLARISGDSATYALAETLRNELLSRLRRIGFSLAEVDFDRCWGIALGYQAYASRARGLLITSGAMTVENCLFVVEGDEEKAAATIRPLLHGRGGNKFLPAIHFYGLALVNIGAVSEAMALGADSGWSSEEPMLLEVVGAANERLGHWVAAHAAYRRSPWPVHRYRAAILEGIIGAPEGNTYDGAFDVDSAMAAEIGTAKTEMTQREVSRSMAFLNACAWTDQPDWLAELELGKICFAQRRFVEADIHLSRALELGPEEAGYAIARLRWTNLTWLTVGGAFTLGLSMVPEALMAGWFALGKASPDDETSEISIWVAQQAGELGLIPIELERLPADRRADAYQALGDRGRAVDCRLEQLGNLYDHRAMMGLIKAFGSAGFELTANRLAEIVLEHSIDDFFVLWETATEIENIVPVGWPGEASDRATTTSDHYRERLVQLSRLEFKNALRCHEFLMQIGDYSAATEVLGWAMAQADGVSELVALAQLRRLEFSDVAGPELIAQGVRLLDRASRQTRDRLERLLIARELFAYGVVRAGRALLESERVFDADQAVALSPIEATIVLYCGRWLSAEEREAVADRAAGRLESDARAGRLGEQALKSYMDRLCDAIGASDDRLAEAARTRLNPLLAAEGLRRDWPGPQVTTDDVIDDALLTLDEDNEQTGAHPVGLTIEGAASSFGLRVVVAEKLSTRLQADLDAIARARPFDVGEDLPAAADYRGDAVRTIELCDLWRSRIVADESGAKEATARLHEFFEREHVLENNWKHARIEARAPGLQRVMRTGEIYLQWLARLVDDRDDHGGHPILRDLFDSVREDIDHLTCEIRGALESAAQELRADVHDSSSP